MKKKLAIDACPEVRKLRLSDLHPIPENPRTISDTALQGLSKSLERFGCVELIVVNTRDGKNRIVGGHQRYKVLRQAGVPECLCVTVDVDEAEEHLLNVSLNNPHIQGEFDDTLPTFLDGLQAEFDMDVIHNLQLQELFPTELEEPAEPVRETLHPYKQSHILLSFPPHVLPEIAEHLEKIMAHPEVEHEDSAN